MNDMGKKTVIFLSSVIPSHSGCPQARRAFIYLRILRCIADVKTLVLDGHGSQYSDRVRLSSDSRLLPMTGEAKHAFEARDASLISKRRSDAVRIQEAIADLSEDDRAVIIYAEDSFIAALAQRVLPVARDIVSMASHYSHASEAGGLFQKLIQSLFAPSIPTTAEHLTLVLSGDPVLDRQVCTYLSKISETVRTLSGRATKIKVFGDLPEPWQESEIWEPSHWRDFIGAMASSWLILNLRPVHSGGAMTVDVANALGVKVASPLGTLDREDLGEANHLIEWASMSELSLTIRQSHAASLMRAGGVADTAALPLPKILQGLTRALGAKLSLKAHPKTIDGFMLDGANARRRSSLHRDFQIYFVPATSLLSVRSYFSHKSGVNEIRVLDQDRKELGRIIPSKLRPDLQLQPINGGIILHDIAAPPAVILQFFETGLFCGEISIASEDISVVTCELAALDFSGTDYSISAGMVWADRSDEPLEILIPRDARHRLMLPSVELQSNDPPKWREFEVQGLFSPHRGESVQLLSEKDETFCRPLKLGSAFTGRRNEIDAKMHDLKNQHSGRRAWIIGNGPSVRYSDLDRIAEQGDIVFCFNRFHLAYPETTLREDFVVSADTLMIEDRKSVV